MALAPKKVQIKRTDTDNHPPADNSLLPGELAVEMGVPLRLWVGVPPVLAPTGQKVLFDSSIGYVNKAGDKMTGNLEIEKANPTLILDKAASGESAAIAGQKGGLNRWSTILGDSEAETGAGNTGSDFAIVRYDDAGVALDRPLIIDRATGLASVLGDPTAPLGIATKAYVDAAATGAVTGIVKYNVVQNLTTAERTQARQNIYAAPFDALASLGLHYNSGFEINQEFPGITLNHTTAVLRYAADGYLMQMNGAVTGTLGTSSVNGGVINIGGENIYATKVLMIQTITPLGALAAADFVALRVGIEGLRSSRLGWGGVAGLPLTIAFCMNANAPCTIGVSAGNANDRTYPVNVTFGGTGWEYKVVTIPPPPSGTFNTDNQGGVYVYLCFGAGANWQGANQTWKTAAGPAIATSATTHFFNTAGRTITMFGFQCWPGSDAPLFSRLHLALRHWRDELVIAQRYCCKSFARDVQPAQAAGTSGAVTGVAATTGAGSVSLKVLWPQDMRAAPSITTYNTNAADANWWDTNGAASRTALVTDIINNGARFVVNAATTAGAQHFIHYLATSRI